MLATAEIAVERRAHLGLARIGVRLEQGRSRHQHAGYAVTALHRLLGDEGALQRMRALVRKAMDEGAMGSAPR